MVLMNLFTRQQWRNRHREQTYGHGERGGEGEMYGGSNMETYTTMCKIYSQCEFVYVSGTQTGALYQPRGVDAAGDGGRFQRVGDICPPMADSY